MRSSWIASSVRLRRRWPAARSRVGAWLASSIPLGLISGRPLSPFETGDLVPLRRYHVLQLRHFGQQLSHERLQLGTGQILKNRRGAHPHNESEREPIRELKNTYRPGSCPSYGYGGAAGM